jgi:hypothetical protein
MRVKLDNLRLLNYYIDTWIVTRATLRVPPIEQDLLALQEHMFVPCFSKVSLYSFCSIVVFTFIVACCGVRHDFCFICIYLRIPVLNTISISYDVRVV